MKVNLIKIKLIMRVFCFEEKDSLEVPKRKVQKKNIIEDDDVLFNDPIGNLLLKLFHFIIQ